MRSLKINEKKIYILISKSQKKKKKQFNQFNVPFNNIYELIYKEQQGLLRHLYLLNH